jgi:hypothetical protein
MVKKISLGLLAALFLGGVANAQPVLQPTVGVGQCGLLRGANLNTTADQPIPISATNTNYRVNAIYVTNASAAVTTAAGGVYTGAGKTGLAIVAAGQAYAGLTTTTVNTAGNLISLTIVNGNINPTSLFLSLTTAEGTAKTADVFVYCNPLP